MYRISLFGILLVIPPVIVQANDQTAARAAIEEARAYQFLSSASFRARIPFATDQQKLLNTETARIKLVPILADRKTAISKGKAIAFKMQTALFEFTVFPAWADRTLSSIALNTAIADYNAGNFVSAKAWAETSINLSESFLYESDLYRDKDSDIRADILFFRSWLNDKIPMA